MRSHWLLTEYAGRNLARPAHDGWHPDAALLDGAFAEAQRRIRAEAARGAIVGAENDQGVGAKALFIQRGQDAADSEIQTLDDGCVERVGLVFRASVLPVQPEGCVAR